MKRIILIFISILLLIFALILYININNNNYKKKLINDIEKNNIEYISKYDKGYIVIDEDYLYLMDENKKIIDSIDKILLCNKIDNYKIIYEKNEFYYVKEEFINDKINYNLYNIYDCNLVKEIVIR